MWWAKCHMHEHLAPVYTAHLLICQQGCQWVVPALSQHSDNIVDRLTSIITVAA